MMKTYYYYYIKDLNNKKLNYFDPTRQKAKQRVYRNRRTDSGSQRSPREREREGQASDKA